MNKRVQTIFRIVCGLTVVLAAVHCTPAWAAVMNDYCIQPPFITQTIPPLVLLSMSKDHKMYYAAYNDASDLNDDGQLDVGYKHGIDYYGYFDPYKCYTYSSSNKLFSPTSLTTDKYCSGTSSEWAGNFLNWLSMTRMDVVRRVLYGGSRTTDTATSTILSGEQIPRDGHSWGKEYPRYEDMAKTPAPADQRKLFPSAVSGKRSLFCVTTNDSSSSPRSLIRVVADPGTITTADVSNGNAIFPLRPWHWASVDGADTICATNKIDNNNDGVAESVTFSSVDYEVSVKVCDSSYLEPVPGKCQQYGANYKPVGILQKFGTSDGTKVCSKTLNKSCTSDTDCNAANNGGTAIGVCLDRSSMYFGLLTGSYKNPQAGGVLRKQISSVLDEINNSTGLFDNTLNAKGNIIGTLENFRCPLSYPLPTHWGNPMGEIIYESLRYIVGLGSATTAFSTGITNGSTGSSTLGNDNDLNLPAPSWDTPLTNFPSCSKPFVLLFSDIYNSYDSDQIPGSDFGTIAATTTNDLPHLNVKALTNTIGTNEALTTAMIGEVKGVNSDTFCTKKTFSSTGKLGSSRGLCPAEPDEQGSFSPAAMAFYGHTKISTELPGKPNVTFYSLPFPSYVPELKIKAGSSTMTIIPTGQSMANGTVNGITWNCSGQYTQSLSPTTQPDTSVNTPSKGLVLTPSGTSTGACPRLQMVSYYILGDPLYDTATGLMKYVRFRISSDDIGGGDYDMDTLAEYEVCEGASCPRKSCGTNNYNYCTSTECSAGHCPDVPNGRVRVTVESKYSSAGNDAAIGFVVAGTTTDGLYLPVRKWNNPTDCTPLHYTEHGYCSQSATIRQLPETRAMIFTPDGTGGTLPKNPLWFAAKYGAFNDINGDGVPYTDSSCGTATPASGCHEWDSQNSGDPDTYYLISNPLQMEQQLNKALTDILKRVASGTAASILSNSEGTGANLIQAIFYPSKIFGSSTTSTVTWSGELLNLWYYIDPFIGNSTIREDTGYTSGSHLLNLATDRIVRFFFDSNPSVNQTKVEFIKDTNGDGVGDSSDGFAYPEDVQALWRAGALLWSTAPADRTVYTSCLPTATCTNGFMGFTAANNTKIQSYLQAASGAEASDIINYLLGTDKTGYRSRNAYIGTQANVWKLGDIVSSTPKIESGLPVNNYHLLKPAGYNDSTYTSFFSTSSYKNRGMVFAGANDGMLHAFKLGTMDVTQHGAVKATLSGANLGTEQWAFIPKQALPYLKYLADPAYNHLYYVDATPVIADISSAKATACTSTDYWDCTRTAASWKSILIGGMGLGGATRITGDSCTDCVKTPRTDPADGTKGLGYSTYFALDVTDPTAPKLKWEFSDPDLGYSMNGPAILRVGDKTKNGRWFAVFVSGPTGPIDTTNHQFMGKSDKPLKVFVLDAESGTLVTTISTLKDNSTIANGFGGSLSGGPIDSDRWNSSSPGNYQDDALYFGYVARAGSSGSYSWTDGGVLRLMTYENIDPTTWKLSKVISGIGPVTTAMARLQNRNKDNENLWLYFGTGRYFYRSGATGVDDSSGQRGIFGIKEPCYSAANDLKNSSDTCEDTPLTFSNLTNQSTGATSALTVGTDKGWYINLDPAASTTGAERIVTNTVALTNGQVFFTSFKPTADICGFGGTSYLWGVAYNTGYQIPPGSLQGKALIQMSTGAFEQINLSSGSPGQNVSIFTDKEERRIGTALQGKPPGDSPLLITRSGNRPVKKIVHVQER